MRFADILKLSLRMFRARTMRTILTILGMSIGIAAILFLVSLGYGLQKALLERITTSDSLVTLDVTEPQSSAITIDDGLLEEIGRIEGVDEVSPAMNIAAQGRVNNLTLDVAVTGTSASYLRFGGTSVAEGEMITEENPHGVVVSSAIAKILDIEATELLGQKVTFTYLIKKESEEAAHFQEGFETIRSDQEYTIIGIVDSEGNQVFINIGTITEIEQKTYDQVKVKCLATDHLDSVRDTLLGLGLLVSSISETVEQANQVFTVIQFILMIFGVIALIVSAIGMFNTMTIALLERTEEIGIMKALGAAPASIAMMFIFEATLMGLLGGLFGVIFGVAGGEVFNGLINFAASRFGGEPVDLFYSPLWFVLTIILFGTFVGFLTSVFPARQASSLDALEALRYK